MEENLEFETIEFDFWSCQIILENDDFILFDNSYMNHSTPLLIFTTDYAYYIQL